MQKAPCPWSPLTCNSKLVKLLCQLSSKDCLTMSGRDQYEYIFSFPLLSVIGCKKSCPNPQSWHLLGRMCKSFNNILWCNICWPATPILALLDMARNSSAPNLSWFTGMPNFLATSMKASSYSLPMAKSTHFAASWQVWYCHDWQFHHHCDQPTIWLPHALEWQTPITSVSSLVSLFPVGAKPAWIHQNFCSMVEQFMSRHDPCTKQFHQNSQTLLHLPTSPTHAIACVYSVFMVIPNSCK